MEYQFEVCVCMEYLSGVSVWSICLEYLSGVSVCMDYLFGCGWLRMVTDGYYLSGNPSPSLSLPLINLGKACPRNLGPWLRSFVRSAVGLISFRGAYKADKAFPIGLKALVWIGCFRLFQHLLRFLLKRVNRVRVHVQVVITSTRHLFLSEMCS